MRRVAAFVLDMLLIAPAAVVVLHVISVVSNRNLLDDSYVWFLVCTVLFALMEHFYAGQTPGKFLTRLRITSVSGSRPTLFALFLRAALFLLFPMAVASVLTIGAYLLFRWSVHFSIVELIAAWILTCASLLFAILSRGSQLFHDYVTNTAVVLASLDRPFRTLGDKVVWAIAVVASAAIVALSAMAHSELLRRVERSDINTSILNQVAPLWLDTTEIEGNIEDLFRYYADEHGPRVPRHLGLHFEAVDFEREQLLAGLGPQTVAQAYEVLTTLKGILSTYFQERVGKNICRSIERRVPTKVCIVEFNYFGSVFDLMYVSASRSVVFVKLPSTMATEGQIFAPISPPTGTSTSVSTFMPWQLQTRRMVIGH